MSGIDPKWVFYLGIAVTIEQGIGQGSVKLANVVPDTWAPFIIGWCTMLAFIGNIVMTALAGYSSKAAGPMIKPLVLVAVIAGGFFIFTGEAQAQAPRRAPAAPASQGPVLTGDLVQDAKNGFKGDPATGIQLTGNLKKDAQALWDKIQGATLVDLQYASAMANAANTNGSSIRKMCWDAIIVVNQKANGVGLKNPDGTPMAKPDPHLFTDVETAAEVLDDLSPQGKLFTSCAGAAQLAQANVIQFISAAISGVAGMAKLAVIPGL